MNKTTATCLAFLGAGVFIACGCVEQHIREPEISATHITQQAPAEQYDYTPKTLSKPGHIKKRVAVAPFGYNVPVLERGLMGPEATLPISQRFNEKLIHQLHKSKRFIVIERRNINEILKELDFQASDYVSKAASEKIGDILGVEIIVTGTFDYSDSGIKYWTEKDKEWALENQDLRIKLEQFGTTGEGREATAQLRRQYRTKRLQDLRDSYDEAPPPRSLYLRIYEVGTSRVVDSVHVDGRTEKELLKKAVRKLSRSIEHIPWTGKIADVEGGTVYINAGRNLGLKEGDEFIVFSLGKEITDPDSGKVIGYQEERIGSIIVESIQDKISKAKIVKGYGTIKEGDKIQFKQPST